MSHPVIPGGDRPHPTPTSAHEHLDMETAKRKLQAILRGEIVTEEDAAAWDTKEARKAEELHVAGEELIRGFMGRLTQPYEVIDPQGLEAKNLYDDDGGTAVTLYSAEYDVTVIIEAMAKRIAPEDVEEMPFEHWVDDPGVTVEDIAGLHHTVIANFFRGKHAPRNEGFYGVSTVFDDFERHIGQLRADIPGQHEDAGQQTIELLAYCQPIGGKDVVMGLKPEVIETLTAWSKNLEVLRPDSQLPGAVGERALGQTIDRPDL